eukprot:gene11043-3749_t
MKNIFDLNHPNILKILKFYEKKKYFLIVSELVDGKNFEEIFNQKEKSQSYDTKIIFQLIEGIQYLHENDLIHGNLSTNQLYLDTNNNLKILYYGFDLFLLEYELGMDIPDFNPFESPEVIKNEDIQFSSDIWSIGVIWYYLKYKEYPFKCIEEFENNSITFLNEISSSNQLIKKMLNKNPNERISLIEILKSEIFEDYSNHDIVYEKEETLWIPDEIMEQIFSFMDPIGLISVSLTCTHWNKMVSILSWNDLIQKDFLKMISSNKKEEMSEKLFYLKEYKKNQIWKKQLEDYCFFDLMSNFLNFKVKKKFSPPSFFLKENVMDCSKIISSKIEKYNGAMNYLILLYFGLFLNNSLSYVLLSLLTMFHVISNFFNNEQLNTISFFINWQISWLTTIISFNTNGSLTSKFIMIISISCLSGIQYSFEQIILNNKFKENILQHHSMYQPRNYIGISLIIGIYFSQLEVPNIPTKMEAMRLLSHFIAIHFQISQMMIFIIFFAIFFTKNCGNLYLYRHFFEYT